MGDYLFTDSKFIQNLSSEKPGLFKWLWNEVKYFVKSVTANTPEAKELVKLEKVFEKAYQDTKKASESGEVRYSLEGYAEDGKGLYRSNFPKGTPKRAKSQKILSYIQNVWSKKPIKLNITDSDGNVLRTIDAKFDPTYDESGETISDASKLMGGNRHGNSSEQRVTLDLADDYYQIASDARYNYSKAETGKDLTTHDNVKEWHYFVNDIYFAEYDSDIFEPYRVTINVKEKTDGNYVYSFSAEKNNETSTPRTLHAVVKGTGSSPNARFVNNSISRDEQIVKHKNNQFEIIEKTNPAPDTYHTWIRSANDVKTFDEVLADDEWSDYSEFDPDYTRDMAQAALESGEITVYSSYPIDQGIFVTPSRMEAKSYSGDGHVYEKTVKLDEVAWIDPTQGMYANVNSKFSLSSDDAVASPVGGDLKISGEEVSIAPPIGEDVPRYRTEPLTGDEIAPPREKTFEEKVADIASIFEKKNPFNQRDIKTVGKKHKLNAVMFDNPDLKHFFQDEAYYMLSELDSGTKGARVFDKELANKSTLKQFERHHGLKSIKRNMPPEIEYLRDECNYTYDQIRKGLNDIIEDSGAENNAVSKKLEILINKRLTEGYTSFTTGEVIEPNKNYIYAINKMTSYSEDPSFDEAVIRALESDGVDLGDVPIREEESRTNSKLRGIPVFSSVYALNKYSDKQIKNWENSKRIVIYENNNQLREFVDQSLSGEIQNKKMYFGTVTAELAKRIYDKTGINVENYNVSLSSYEIQKINKDHGNEKKEALRGQRAVTADDYILILDAIQDSDSITLSDKTFFEKPVLQFEKGDNEKINVAAVVSDKHLDLFVQTAFINKKRNLATPTADQAAVNTPKASSGTVPNNIIPDAVQNVKGDNKKSENAEQSPEVKEARTYFAMIICPYTEKIRFSTIFPYPLIFVKNRCIITFV